MKCERCGKDKEDTQMRPDPFANEIYDDNTKIPICDECWQVRADDI